MGIYYINGALLIVNLAPLYSSQRKKLYWTESSAVTEILHIVQISLCTNNGQFLKSKIVF